MQMLTTNIAKILFAGPFIVFGILHFMNGSAMAGMVPSFIPGGVFWVYVTGLALIAAPVAIFTGKQAKTACLLLALMLCLFVLTIHLPGVISGNMSSMPNLLKDLALAGGALTYAGIFERQGATSEKVNV